MFDNVDRLYGDFDMALKGGSASEDGGEDGGALGGGGGASFSGGGIGGEDLDFSDEEPEGEEASLEGGEIPARRW
jgi:hypothetical protein